MTPSLTLRAGSRTFGRANEMGTMYAPRFFGPRRLQISTRLDAYVAVPYFPTSGRAQCDSTQGFYREIVKWKYLSHPHVVPFLGVSESLLSFCILSPWLQNGDIVEYTRRYPAVNRLQLVSEYRNLHGQTVSDSVLGSLRNLPVASNIYIRRA